MQTNATTYWGAVERPRPSELGKDCWVDMPGETQHKKQFMTSTPATLDDFSVSPTSPSSHAEAWSWQESLVTVDGHRGLSCEIHKARLLQPCSSCVPPTPTTSPPRASSTSSSLVMGVWDRNKHIAPATRGSSLTRLDSGDRLAIGCWYTSLLPVLSCSPWGGNVVRCVLTYDTRLAHVELLEEVDIFGVTMRPHDAPSQW